MTRLIDFMNDEKSPIGVYKEVLAMVGEYELEELSIACLITMHSLLYHSIEFQDPAVQASLLSIQNAVVERILEMEITDNRALSQHMIDLEPHLQLKHVFYARYLVIMGLTNRLHEKTDMHVQEYGRAHFKRIVELFSMLSQRYWEECREARNDPLTLEDLWDAVHEIEPKTKNTLTVSEIKDYLVEKLEGLELAKLHTELDMFSRLDWMMNLVEC